MSKLYVGNYAKVIGSLLYAFNGYTIFNGTAEFEYVTIMVFLPLILYSFECLLIDKKLINTEKVRAGKSKKKEVKK